MLQSTCPICGRSASQTLCLDCIRQLKTCEYQRPAQDWQGTLPLFAWGSYEGSLKRAIAVLKYQHQPEIGELLGTWLAETWRCQPPHAVRSFSTTRIIVVPIPLHRDRQQHRGYNQAELIAQRFCQITGLTLNTSLLIRHRATEVQHSLTVQQRQQNLNQAFRVQSVEKVQDRPILLLDDIYTTGATAQAAVAALRAARLSVLGIAAIAKTERS